MASVAVTNTFTAGTTIVASQVNANFSDLVNYINNRNSASSAWDALSVAGTSTLTGAVTNSALTASRALVTDGSKVLTSATTTATEIGYVNGVTSAIQTQLNLKAPLASPTFSGTITTPLTASRVVKTDGSNALTTGAVTLSSSNEVTGTLATGNGGTGLTTKFFTTGTYTGNGTTQNIAHGLGATPNLVIICTTGTGTNIPNLFITGMTNSHAFDGVNTATGITGVDSTNISVGASTSVNQNTVGYAFICFKAQ